MMKNPTNIKPISNPVATTDEHKDVDVGATTTSANAKHAQQLLVNSRQNSGQSKTNETVDNSWATTISHYLLQRRRQTRTAYQDQLQPSTAVYGGSDADDWLFEALFDVLVQRLKEGHTVLMLEEGRDIDSIKVTSDLQNDDTGLLNWQQQLLQPLLQPLLMHAENTLGILIGAELLVDKALWDATRLQSTLTKYEQQILQQRYDTCVKLYNYLKQIAQAQFSNSIENSLSKFAETLNNEPLLKANTDKIDSPIIFQTNKHLQEKNSTGKNITLTLWLHRTWQAERALAYHIMRIKEQTVDKLPITINPLLNIEQQDAIHMANQSAFSIITGGPGTGKTFTVAQLVIALKQAQAKENGTENKPNNANLALAAPTGKAAQRMQESLQDAIQHTGVDMQLPEAKTIHRLLGIGKGGKPRYNADNPLSEDIIIIDEASMLGVELANYLVSAIKPKARLILLGDANQLAAVDAGAVLADLCRIPALQDVHQRLEVSRRFSSESGIGRLARLINTNNNDMAAVWQLMEENGSLFFYHLNHTTYGELDIEDKNPNKIKNSLSNIEFLKKTQENYNQYIKKTKKMLEEKKYPPNIDHITHFYKLMTLLNQFKVLTAGHYGRCGDHHINRYLSEQHRSQLKIPLSKSPWYHGRPIMVLQNDYELGLFNGDIGICLQTEKGRLKVFFENKTQGIPISMLSDEMTATAYAMTIHKSQGSEFEHVAISFDDNNGRLLSQELIYTAVTRAKKKVSIFSTASAFTQALATPTKRQTGLSLQFSHFNQKL